MPLFQPEPSDPRCRVKICGLVSAEDARRCAGLGADAVGFNFWAGSRRYVAPSEAALWLRELPPHPLRVGVFVDAEPGEILALLRSCTIDAAQLHGSESPEDCRRILDSGFPVIKAIGLRDRRSVSDIEPFLNGSVSALLLDAYAPGLYGGTGQALDWSLAAEIAAMCAGLPVILAGGLNPENVAQAIATVRPRAVDVASGVETQPGCKDWDAVRNFILRAHSALPSQGPVANSVRPSMFHTQTFRIAVLPGDGIGPEVMTEALQILDQVAEHQDLRFHFDEQLVGGAAIDATGQALPPETLRACEEASAILFGSVGGPKWEKLPPAEQPERGALLPLRRHFRLFANLRPSICYPSLTHASPLKEEIIRGGFDVLCVRELTGGLYFGEPKGCRVEAGERVAVDTMIYRESEIERIAHAAFKAAGQRRGLVTSVDKANVLENGLLWRAVVERVARHYPGVRLDHLYVDNAAMQLIRRPKDFDVILTENLFGDILSDEMAMIAGSLGMLASASLGDDRGDGSAFGLYEPSGGSAPDIADQGIANPVAQILSGALLLRYSLGLPQAAELIEGAVRLAIDEGARTRDIFTGAPGTRQLSTREMGEAIRSALQRLAADPSR